jgi:hypothetical protein
LRALQTNPSKEGQASVKADGGRSLVVYRGLIGTETTRRALLAAAPGG